MALQDAIGAPADPRWLEDAPDRAGELVQYRTGIRRRLLSRIAAEPAALRQSRVWLPARKPAWVVHAPVIGVDMTRRDPSGRHPNASGTTVDVGGGGWT